MMARPALQEISTSPFLVRRGFDPDSNFDLIPDSYLTPSPEEQIIQQRSRRALVQSLSLPFDDNIENDADFLKTPCKDLSFSSLNRKRLLLTPDSHSSPVKYQPKPKKPRLLLPKKCKPCTPIGTELRAYSTQQLVDVIDRLLNQHPQLEKEVRSQLPQPDIRVLTDKLKSLRRNVYKALPSSRLSTGRDAAAFKRVKVHLEVFRKELSGQGRTLLLSQCWSSTIKYVLKAWRYVGQLPNWDNPSHNELKNQCFMKLAAHCMVALRRGSFNNSFLRDVQEKFILAHHLSDEIEPCLKYIAKLLMVCNKDL